MVACETCVWGSRINKLSYRGFFVFVFVVVSFVSDLLVLKAKLRNLFQPKHLVGPKSESCSFLDLLTSQLLIATSE